MDSQNAQQGNSENPAPEKMVVVVDEPLMPPFWGAQVWEPTIEEVYPHIEPLSLLAGRWGFKKGNLPEAEYRQILEGEAQSHFERLKRENLERRLLVPRAAVAWHTCRPEGDSFIMTAHGTGKTYVQNFPRQQINEKLCLSDFYRKEGDILGCFTVTVGSAEATAEVLRMKEDGEYQNYFFWMGFAAEYADAVAEWAHRKMLEPLGGRKGARFGPGYPSCPDTGLSRTIAELTEAWRIGVTVTDSNMLEPEMSTSAVMAHRPRARIFNRLV